MRWISVSVGMGISGVDAKGDTTASTGSASAGLNRELVFYTRAAVLGLFGVAVPISFLLGHIVPGPIAQFGVLTGVVAVTLLRAHQNGAVTAALGAWTLVFALTRIGISVGPSELFLADIGPYLWALYVPAGLLFVVLARRGEFPPIAVCWPFGLFAAALMWALATGGLSTVPVTATLFVVHLAIAWGLGVAVYSARVDGSVSTVGIVEAILTVIGGHIALGLVQLVVGGTIGVPFLGEAQQLPNGSIVLLGQTIATGKHIGGLAYRGPYSVLLTLSIPVFVTLAIRSRGRRRGMIAATLGGLMTLLVTGWDAAYGGTLIALGIVGALVWQTRGTHTTYVGSVAVGGTIILGGAGVAGVIGAMMGAWVSNGQVVDAIAVVEAARTLNLPGFSLANLPIRIKQYATGLNLLTHRPMTGYGLGYFYFTSPHLGFDQPYFMHNVALQWAVGAGVPGALLYLGGVGAGFVSLARRLADSGRDETLLIGGVLAGLVGVHAQLFLQPQLVRLVSMSAIWLLLGATIRTPE